jgi:hypothetical protein
MDKKKVAGIKIFFSAVNPKKADAKTITIEEDKSKEANFQWVAYQLLFSTGDEDPTYYIYNSDLTPDGSDKGLFKVFKSDSNWSADNKNNPERTGEFSPSNVRRMYPELLKGPNLTNPEKYSHDAGGFTVSYVNIDESDKGTSYSTDKFKKFFDNEFYVVLNPNKNELKNPFGVSVGQSVPKEGTDMYSQAVKVAMEKRAAISGNFGIMQDLYYKKHKRPPSEETLTGGFNEMGSMYKKIPSGQESDFDLIQEQVKNPPEVKKNV